MAKSVNGGGDDTDNETTPICRCRVLYLGSAVPHITKDGLQGIQEPLRDLYPEQGVFWNTDRDHIATGIDSWLSVWSNGILVENVDDKGNTIRRFHPIESLHYCAAVRYVSVPANDTTSTKNGSSHDSNKIAKFLPLDSPFSKNSAIDPMKMGHPPLFACILRRTSGIKVLECHAFICKKEAAANALVRCCFHAYADTMHAKQIELESPYEQLDRRRSRSIGSALDSQSLIDDKINTWQKNSAGSSTGSPDETNGFGETRSISRQKQQQRTPSVASLVSHSMAAEHHHHHPQLPPPPLPPHLHHGLPMMGLPEPIYGIPPTGTLRSVRSFISLAALKSHKKSRSRQIPLPFAHGLPPPPLPPQPQPVMFATLSKKELKKVLKKESTLKRKHKYKDFPLPFVTANGYPAPPPPPPQFIYGPPPPLPPHGIHPGPMPIYAPPMGPSYYGTIDSRKSRIPSLPPPPPPPPTSNMINENGHMLPPPPPPPPSSHFDEPIYMPAVPSPNGTLRPVTPHGEPIYFEGRTVNGLPPMPMPIHHHPGPPGPMFMGPTHPQMVPCTLIPTLSRKELKELEKQKALMKKAAKKEKKNAKKNKNQQPPHPQQQQIMTNGNGQLYIEEPPPGDYYQPRPYGYPPEEIGDPDESIISPSEMQLSSGNYSNASTGGGGGGGGIYKKKGHLNERAFSYSIRQEHRSRSNSLSNLAFENGPNNGSGRNGENESHNNSSVSLKSQTDAMAAGQPVPNGPKMMNGNGSIPYEQHHHTNGNGRIPLNNGHSHHNGGPMMMMDANGPIDPNTLATRMSNLSLKNGYGPNNPPPPPPPLPTNGYHYQQRTATIKRL